MADEIKPEPPKKPEADPVVALGNTVNDLRQKLDALSAENKDLKSGLQVLEVQLKNPASKPADCQCPTCKLLSFLP